MSVQVYDRPKRADRSTRLRLVVYTFLFIISVAVSVAIYFQFTEETPPALAPGPNTQTEVVEPAP